MSSHNIEINDLKKISVRMYLLIGIGCILWWILDQILIFLHIKLSPDLFFDLLRIALGLLSLFLALIRSKWNQIIYPSI